MSILQIYFFGTGRLLLNEQILPFNAPPKTLPLLAYLLLQRGQPVVRSQAAAALWPDLSEDTARANLRRHLHHLLKVLPPADPQCPWIVADARSLQWNPAAFSWLDVAEFEKCAQAGQYDEAVALYGGSLLEVVDEDWLYLERERLDGLYLDCLARLTSACRARRDFAGAIELTRRILLRNPFHEGMQRQLITLYHESGDRPSALQAYESFRHSLMQELGVVPMAETRALHELVLRDTPLAAVQEPTQVDESPALERAILPFAGRGAEMAQLSASWQHAAAGQGCVAILSGEAGAGKSRLARELALLVESQGGRVLVGKSSPGEPRPYQPVVEAFLSALPLVAAVPMPPALLDALILLIPEIKQHLPARRATVLPRLAPEQDRTRLYSAVTACLDSLARVRPILLILDDLHWASEASLSLVEFMAHAARGIPILILCIYREEEPSRVLSSLCRRLEQDLQVAHLALSSLTVEDVGKLLERLEKNNRLPGSTSAAGGIHWLQQQLFSASEGSPLFIDLLLAAWRERGFPADSGQTESAGHLPAGLRDAISQRLASLPDLSRAYAELAAVVGPAFEDEVVRAAGGWSEAQALTSGRVLLDRRLIREAESRSSYDFTFAHHLIQVALYDETPLAKRKRRHYRVAEVLETLHAAESSPIWAAQLANHFDLGGCPERAVPWYYTAARQRLAVYADASALEALERALVLLDVPGRTTRSAVQLEQTFTLLMEREAILNRQGRRTEQVNCLEQMESLARTLADDERLCLTLRRRCAYLRLTADMELEKQVIAGLKQVTIAQKSPMWQARIAIIEGGLAFALSDFAQANHCYQQALSLLENLSDPDSEVECLCRLADIAIQLRDHAAAEIWVSRALTLSGALEGSYRLQQVLWTIAAAALTGEDMARCLDYGQKLVDLARKLGDLSWEAHALRLIGMANNNRFQIALAREQLSTAHAIYTRINHAKGQGLALQSLASLANAVGKNEESLALYQQSYEINLKTNDLSNQCGNLINQAYISAQLGDYFAQRSFSLRALELARSMKNVHLEAFSLCNLSEAERELGVFPSALAHAQQSADLFASADRRIERGSALIDLAKTYLALGQLDDAEAVANELMELYPQAQGAKDNDHAWLWLAARVWRACGRTGDAQAVLAQAYQSVQTKAAAIPDFESHAAFLKDRISGQIVAAFTQDLWP